MRRASRLGAPRCGRGPKEEALRFGAWIAFADETGASTDPAVRRTWGRRGQTPLIAVSRKRRQRMNASGWLCVNPADGRVRLVYTAQRDSITQHEVPDLISRVRSQLGAPVVLVWDNHSSHTARWVSRELANRAFRSLEELEKVLRSHLRSVQRRHPAGRTRLTRQPTSALLQWSLPLVRGGLPPTPGAGPGRDRFSGPAGAVFGPVHHAETTYAPAPCARPRGRIGWPWPTGPRPAPMCRCV